MQRSRTFIHVQRSGSARHRSDLGPAESGPKLCGSLIRGSGRMDGGILSPISDQRKHTLLNHRHRPGRRDRLMQVYEDVAKLGRRHARNSVVAMNTGSQNWLRHFRCRPRRPRMCRSTPRSRLSRRPSRRRHSDTPPSARGAPMRNSGRHDCRRID